MTMDCKRANELFPWLLNRTLPAEEQEELERHLEGCEPCRAELEETRATLVVALQHLSPQTLTALALERDPGEGSELTASHLASCESCAEELALLRRSRDEMDIEGAAATPAAEGGKVLPMRPRPPRTAVMPARWRVLAMAASLAGIVASGVAWWSWRLMGSFESRLTETTAENHRLRDEAREGEALRRRLSALENENRLLRSTASAAPQQRLTELQGELAGLRAQLAAPRLNVTLVDLYPDEVVLRSSAEAPEELSGEAPFAALIFNSELRSPPEDLGVEIRDGSGRAILDLRGLSQDADGVFTLALPTSGLPREDLILVLYQEVAGQRTELESYRLRVH